MCEGFSPRILASIFCNYFNLFLVFGRLGFHDFSLIFEWFWLKSIKITAYSRKLGMKPQPEGAAAPWERRRRRRRGGFTRKFFCYAVFFLYVWLKFHCKVLWKSKNSEGGCRPPDPPKLGGAFKHIKNAHPHMFLDFCFVPKSILGPPRGSTQEKHIEKTGPPKHIKKTSRYWFCLFDHCLTSWMIFFVFYSGGPNLPMVLFWTRAHLNIWNFDKVISKSLLNLSYSLPLLPNNISKASYLYRKTW